MRQKIGLGIILTALSTPAFAGSAVPTPEAGAGFAAMGLLAAGYVYLRKRSKRQ